VLNLRPERRRWTIELLTAALRLANYAEMRFKHALACRRPIEYSPQIQPMILTPGHGSLPSGHATEAFIVALVLWELSRGAVGMSTAWLEQLMRQAARVAINRTIAGVHFPVDSAAGQLLGLTLGAYFVQRATAPVAGGANFQAYEFDGTQFGKLNNIPGNRDEDFNWRLHFQVPAPAVPPPPPPSVSQQEVPDFAMKRGAQSVVRPAWSLATLWSEAKKEWP
jgi:hypothetical protein